MTVRRKVTFAMPLVDRYLTEGTNVDYNILRMHCGPCLSLPLRLLDKSLSSIFFSYPVGLSMSRGLSTWIAAALRPRSANGGALWICIVPSDTYASIAEVGGTPPLLPVTL